MGDIRGLGLLDIMCLLKRGIKMRRLILLFSVFITANSYAGQLQAERYFANNGGLFDHISPLLVPNRNATAISNFTLDDRGQLTKRLGYTILNTTGTISTYTVTGGGYLNSSNGNSFFAVVVGTNVFKTGNTFAGTWTNVSGATITNASTNLTQVTSLQNKLIFCNDSDKPFTLTSTGNSVQISTSTFTKAKTCAAYSNYLVVGNTFEGSTSFPSRIRWSDINNTESFPDLNYWDVEPDDGDQIVSIVTFEDSVYIFKRHSIYRMLVTGGEGPDAFIIRPLSRNIGAWAKNSVKVIPNVGIAFLAQNTAYIYDGANLEPIGDPIQRTFDAVNRQMWAKAVGEVYPKRYQYWLSVSVAGTTNDEVLVYDYVQKAWTTYTGMSFSMLAQSEDSNGANILISGSYIGNVYKQDVGNSDYPNNVKTNINASYTTADLNFGQPEYTKNFKYLYLFSKVDSSTTVSATAYYDYVTTQPIDINLGTANLTLATYDTAVYDSDIYPNIVNDIQRVELNRSGRSIKLAFVNNSSDANVSIIGWVIVYSLESWRE